MAVRKCTVHYLSPDTTNDISSYMIDVKQKEFFVSTLDGKSVTLFHFENVNLISAESMNMFNLGRLHM